jgi:hypothetical protein
VPAWVIWNSFSEQTAPAHWHNACLSKTAQAGTIRMGRTYPGCDTRLPILLKTNRLEARDNPCRPDTARPAWEKPASYVCG